MRIRSTSFALALAFVASVAATPAVAGPPLLCGPFDTASAPSLPWGEGWRDARADFPLETLAERTLELLGAEVPLSARMETLRRAAIYAARDGAVLRAVMRGLDGRVHTADDLATLRLALFDSGYFLETLQDIERLQGYDMPGIGAVDREVLRALLRQPDGSERIAQALALHPDDGGMRFAAALVAAADGAGP